MKDDDTIELVKLANGDIALRHSSKRDEPLVTISISDQVDGILSSDKIDIAQSMVEAGIDRYRHIQNQRVEQEKQLEVSSSLLH